MNFIEVYDNVLSKEECELLIRHFENVDPCRKQMNAVNKAQKVGTTLMCDWEDDIFDDFECGRFEFRKGNVNTDIFEEE